MRTFRNRIAMLHTNSIVAFVATTDSGRAHRFYGDVLGLPAVSEDDFAIVFDAGGTMLRVTNVREMRPAVYTVLGWEVADIDAAVDALGARGVQFEIYPE